LQSRGNAREPESGSVEPALAHVASLLQGGRDREALAFAADRARETGDMRLVREMMRLRNQTYQRGVGRPDWPPAIPDLFPDKGVPDITAADLSTELLGSAILHHGAIIVRGLLAEPLMGELRAGADKAISLATRSRAGDETATCSPWYCHVPDSETFDLNVARAFAELDASAVLAGDSPILFEKIRERYEAMGVFRAVEGYLGERPMLSLAKTVLRRVPANNGSEWHQDGAFLGADTRVVNLWLTLSDCGVDAPGLEIVAGRLERILPVGTGDAQFDWSVGPSVVAGEIDPALIQSPVFKAGDAMLFDHLFLHRTGVRPTMTKTRYAVEAWMFAPSTFPTENFALMV
jgi:hypothetical protein